MPSELQLADVLSEFARTMLTDFPIQGILDRLVNHIVDVLPITAAGVTVIASPSDPRYLAASDQSALRFEELQTELGEGPRLLAYESGGAVTVPDLREESRFPTFGPRALEAGLVAVFTFPLRQGDQQVGALDLYRTSPGPLDAATVGTAQMLADVTAAYLLNARARADLRDLSKRSHTGPLHDPLTGLPNRTLFLARLEQAGLRGRRSGRMAAVLFVGLHRFKVVNDLYGHGVGDELLVAVARRLSATLRSGDTLARLPGDEFVVLCEDFDGAEHVDAIAARIVAAIAGLFVLSGVEANVTASVAIAFSGRSDRLRQSLLHQPDAATYQAKRKAGARRQVVDLRVEHVTADVASLEHDLRGATARREMRTEYQPIVDTSHGSISGVEALVRWAHPTRGLVSPDVLVPLAERAGLMTEIGQWVLERSCQDRQHWQNHHYARDELTMSVNVSARQLMSPNFVTNVADVLSGTATEPELMVLEVTESSFVQDSERALVVLRQLKDLGVRLALDDFGTGYSSLNFLKRFPIDIVKIDHACVADLDQGPASSPTVLAVIRLAHMLGMTVVAEGVETAAQYTQLASFGCDSCQGYYFAHPMDADSLDSLVQQAIGGEAVHLPALTTAAHG